MPNIEISETAYDYLKSVAIPFEDTPASILDRIIEEHSLVPKNQTEKSSAKSSLELNFGLNDTPNVTFTTIDAAYVGGAETKSHYWNDILEEMLILAHGSADMNTLNQMLKLQFVSGDKHEDGYRPVKGTGFSFQGVDANRACKNIATLSEKFNIPVTLNIRWYNKSKAQFPGKAGTIKLP